MLRNILASFLSERQKSLYLRDMAYWCDQATFWWQRSIRKGWKRIGPDVVLHIGLPKTGSSVIQRFCLHNRGALLKAGFYYPEHDLDPNGVSGGHAKLISPLIGNDSKQYRYLLERLLEESRQVGATLVLSHEGLHRHAGAIGAVFEGLDVQVIGWFRHPVDAFISNRGQGVKRSFTTDSLANAARKFVRSKAYSALDGRTLHAWADVVGDDACTFLPYLPKQHSLYRPVELQWMDALKVAPGVQRAFAQKGAWVNRSYSLDALELKRLLNGVLKTGRQPDVSRAIDVFLQSYSDRQPAHAPLIASISADMVAGMIAKIEGSLKLLTLRFPSLLPVLNSSQLLMATAGTATGAVNCSEVLLQLRAGYPREFAWIEQRVNDEIREGTQDETVLMLASLLGCNLQCEPADATG